MNNKIANVAIIGAGPAGLACAAELSARGIDNIILIDKGPSLRERKCPSLIDGKCRHCSTCAVYSGFGGASGLLGGKLCFFPAGSRLTDHIGVSSNEANHKFLSFAHRMNSSNKVSNGIIKDFGSRLAENDWLRLKSYISIPFLHKDLNLFFNSIISFLSGKSVVFLNKSEVLDISPNISEDGYNITIRRNFFYSDTIKTRFLVLASGRSGATWLSNKLLDLGLSCSPDFVDIGVRVEVPNRCGQTILPMLHDPKLKLRPGQPDEVRTLCWCRGGTLTQAIMENQVLVDGHFGEGFTNMTSVSIVAREKISPGVPPFKHAMDQFSSKLKKPFSLDLHAFMGFLGRKNHMPLKESIYSERVDWTSVMDRRLHFKLNEMLIHLMDYTKGSYGSLGGRVYGPVVDKFWETPSIDSKLETMLKNVYIAGDATGLARGIVQSVFSGLTVAESIASKLKSSLNIEPKITKPKNAA